MLISVGENRVTGKRPQADASSVSFRRASFQVMRGTHASLSRKAGIDPKLVADQLGHGLGVNLEVYTIAGLDQRLAAVSALEQRLASSAIN